VGDYWLVQAPTDIEINASTEARDTSKRRRVGGSVLHILRHQFLQYVSVFLFWMAAEQESRSLGMLLRKDDLVLDLSGTIDVERTTMLKY
jgi:hypothetical protein